MEDETNQVSTSKEGKKRRISLGEFRENPSTILRELLCPKGVVVE